MYLFIIFFGAMIKLFPNQVEEKNKNKKRKAYL